MKNWYKGAVEELTERFPQEARRYIRSLIQVGAVGDYLDEMRKNEAEGLKDCNPYIVRQFSYMEYKLDLILLELRRINSAVMERECIVVEWEPGEYMLIDYTTDGRMKPITVYTREEYREAINRHLESRFNQSDE